MKIKGFDTTMIHCRGINDLCMKTERKEQRVNEV